MSKRGFGATLEAALDDREINLALAVYLNWPTGVLRLWSGIGSKSWSGNTYTGVGSLGSIDKFVDGLEKTDTGISLVLNYLDDTLRNQVLANDPIGADASVYLWLMLPSSGAILDGYELFPGYIDEVVIEDEGATGKIIVRLASELARLTRSTSYTLSDAHQQLLFPGDVGLEFAARMDEPILWGRAPVQVTAPKRGGRVYQPAPGEREYVQRPQDRRTPSSAPADAPSTPRRGGRAGG